MSLFGALTFDQGLIVIQNAPTPAAAATPGYLSAPTPAAYTGAPTPAGIMNDPGSMSAPTPGVSGNDEDPDFGTYDYDSCRASYLCKE